MRKKSGTRIVAFLFLFVMAIIWMLPLLYGFFTSFKSHGEIMTSGFKIMPAEWVMSNYTNLLVNNTSCLLYTSDAADD